MLEIVYRKEREIRERREGGYESKLKFNIQDVSNSLSLHANTFGNDRFVLAFGTRA